MGWCAMRQRFTAIAAALSIAALMTAGGCSSGSDSSASGAGSSESGLSLVVIGDSIPYNSPDDCPGCTGFVDRYADALAKATGKKVTTSNLSQHNGLTLPMLMNELKSFEDELSNAD